MKRDEILFTAILLLAVLGLTLALTYEAKKGRHLGMYSEGCVIGTVVAVQPAETEKRPDVLIVEDLSRPEWPQKIACEFFSGAKKLLTGLRNGQLVRVVGSIKSMESRNGGWFTHFTAFQLSPLTAYTELQAQASRKQHTERHNYTEPGRDADESTPF